MPHPYNSRVKQTVVAGTTALTAIPIVGMKLHSSLVGVIAFNAGVPADLTAEATSGQGSIQLATTDTTGQQLVVTWSQ